jgi:hypothetical protein
MKLRPILRELAFHWPFLLAAWLYAAAMTPACGEIPYNSVGTVHAPLSGMEASGGSGTLVAKSNDKAVVITAYHVIKDATGQITVDFRNSKTKYAARVIKVDPDYDIAALLIAAPPEVEPPAGIKVLTAEDGPFTRIGHPWYGKGQQHYSVGDLMPDEMTGASAWAPSMAHTTGTSPSGFSGGGMFDKDGYYCGLVSGNTSPGMQYAPDRTWGCSGDVLVQFCQSSCNGNCPLYVYPQPSRRQVIVTPTQPQPRPTPTQVAFDADKLKADILVEVTGLIEAARCQCDHTECMTLRMTENLIAEAIANIEAKPINYQELANNIDVNQVVQQLDVTKIAQAIAENLPKPPTEEQLTDAVVARLQPINIRVQDARGPEYSTQYQEIRVGTQKQYVTLPFGPRN